MLQTITPDMLTPWFDGATTIPHRSGIYQRQRFSGIVVYAKFDAEKIYWYIGSTDLLTAKAETILSSVMCLDWRGLTFDAAHSYRAIA